MNNVKITDTNNDIQTSNSIAEQKAKYEKQKEQERKRRFLILAGDFKPIQTTLNLKEEEKVYFQTEADRMAEKEYVEYHTTGQSRTPFIRGGILRGNSKISTNTTQSRSSANAMIDTGILLFTNLRVLFVGKQIVSIPFKEILAIHFTNNSVTIKYPKMVKNEAYNFAQNSDVKFHYFGLMRILEKDKSKATEADVDMSDYPRFVSEQETMRKKNIWLFVKICIWIGIFFTIKNLFWSSITTFIIIVIFVIACCAVSYPILRLSNRDGEYEYGLMFTKKLLIWSLGVLVLSFLEASIFSMPMH